MKAEIHFVGTTRTITIESNYDSFKDFVLELFKSPVYVSLSKKTPSCVVNIKNVNYVLEVLE